MTWNISDLANSIVAKLRARGTPSDQLDAVHRYHTAALSDFSLQFENRFQDAAFLGMGGSGIVLKLTSGEGSEADNSSEPSVLPKCLKYPHPCIGVPGDFSLMDVIDNEAARLRQINHPHIMPLEDTACAELGSAVSERDRRVPAYLMPYIRSAELSEFLASPEATSDQMITLLIQAADALSYLHARDLLHLDIKPANILVAMDSPGQPRALVSDFGFCKHIVFDSPSRTLVMGTDGYIDPDLLLLMVQPTSSNENRVRARVPRNKLSPQFDRYSFGATVLDSIVAFLEPNEADGSPRTIPTSLLRGLLFVALRCCGRHPQEMRGHDKYPKRRELAPEGLFRSELADAFAYSISDDLKEDLARLQGNRLAFLEPEVAEATGDAVCLPERMFVPLSARVIDTLDSVMVRRLATIAQLALCYHVYPGASHTRKEHVLGAYRTTCRLLRQLVLDPANPIGSMILKAPQQRLAMVGTLLHDMSHIPLMHEFEDSVPELSQRTFTAELLAGDWGGDEFASELRNVLASWDVELDDLRLILGSRGKAPLRFKSENTQKDAKDRWESEWDRADLQLVRSIIDGSVDADKIDYLQRDALHVGVRFGHGVDAERIETQMTTVIETEGSGREPLTVRCRMGAWRKGQAAAESLIGVRHSMYSQVYAHRTVRAARSMLNYITWKWRVSARYSSCEGEEIARDLFGFASSLGPPKSQRPLFEPAQAEVMAAVNPRNTDNLPFNDSRVIRWMAFVSGDSSAGAMAEALISRRLYKNVSSLEPREAEGFMRIAFLKKKNIYSPRLSADQWLSLVEYLSFRLKAFLSDSGSISVPISSDLLPPLLLDIAIPKTMRTQSELSIVEDALANAVTWKRLTRIEGARVTVVPGAVIERSKVYEAYGGGQDDSLEPIKIRLFARSDLAPELRPRVDSRNFSSWLAAFRPPGE